MSRNPHQRFECPLCKRKSITNTWLEQARPPRKRGADGRIQGWADASARTPCCDGKLSAEQLKTLWGQAMVARRERVVPGTGRPPSKDRCPCGLMTRDRAQKRRHFCNPQ